jgi:hypothetical protein
LWPRRLRLAPRLLREPPSWPRPSHLGGVAGAESSAGWCRSRSARRWRPSHPTTATSRRPQPASRPRCLPGRLRSRRSRARPGRCHGRSTWEDEREPRDLYGGFLDSDRSRQRTLSPQRPTLEGRPAGVGLRGRRSRTRRALPRARGRRVAQWVLFSLFGIVMLLTGLADAVGGLTTGDGLERQLSRSSILLGMMRSR